MSTPGVYVTTDVRTGPPTGTAPAGAALFAAGEAQYGPVSGVVECNSMAEFEYAFGGRYGNGYLWDTAKSFFEEGGSRFVGYRLWKDAAPATPVADKVSQVRFATSDTADTEVEVRAKYLGAWGDSVVCTYTAGAGTNKLVITGLPDNRTETFTFSGATVTAANFVAAINSTSSGSAWVEAEVVLKAAGTPPVDPTATVTAAVKTLTGAQAAVTPTFIEAIAAVDPSSSVTQYFTAEYGTGAICIPGYGPTTSDTSTDDGYDVWYTLIKHCVAYSRVAILSFGDDEITAANAITWKASFLTYIDTKTDVPATTNGLEYAGLYMPWVNVPNGVGGTRVVPPEGFVAAARARAHTTEGTHRAGAGAISSSLYVTTPTVMFSGAELDNLATAQINPIRVIAGSTRVYGACTLSSDPVNWKFVTYRDTLNYIAYEAESRLEPYVFATIDSKQLLFSKIRGALIGFLETMRQSNTLYEMVDSNGDLIDPGYSVDVSEGINPPANLANGIITAQVGVRVSPVGERINLTITKAALTSGL